MAVCTEGLLKNTAAEVLCRRSKAVVLIAVSKLDSILK